MSKFRKLGNQLYSGERSFDFVGKKNLWYAIAAVAVILAVSLPILRGGFNFGIEFRGGSEFRVNNSQELPQSLAVETVNEVVPGVQVNVAAVGFSDLRIQTEQLEDVESEEVRLALAEAFGVDPAEVASSFVGPNWGADVTRQALIGLGVFLLLVSLLMAFYFRSWKMSVAALLALAHDLVLTAGVYAGVGFEVTPAAVIGFLTILAYSLYDTVVVFDRVRENLRRYKSYEQREILNLSLNETLSRTVMTSVTTLLALLAIVVFGGAVLRDFALAMMWGVIIGTYSSVFVAVGMLAKFDLKRTEEDEEEGAAAEQDGTS